MRPTINSLKKPDWTDTQDSREIADVFNEYFSSVFTLSENNTVPQFQLDREVSPIADIDINADIVYNKLISLKTTNLLALMVGLFFYLKRKHYRSVSHLLLFLKSLLNKELYLTLGNMVI